MTRFIELKAGRLATAARQEALTAFEKACEALGGLEVKKTPYSASCALPGGILVYLDGHDGGSVPKDGQMYTREEQELALPDGHEAILSEPDLVEKLKAHVTKLARPSEQVKAIRVAVEQSLEAHGARGMLGAHGFSTHFAEPASGEEA